MSDLLDRAGDLAARGLRRGPVVLMYHGFCTERRDDDPENLFVPIARFEEQLSWLAENGWTALTLDQYLEVRAGARPPGRKTVLITIDDGYPSVAELAAPVLARHAVPALLYVPAGLLGSTAEWLPSPADEPILDAADLRRVSETAPVEIGLHGWDHQDMTTLTAAELVRHTRHGREVLTEALGAPIRSFAYPYGSHDAASRAAVRDAGFGHAFSVFVDAGPLAVSRVDVNATDSLASFRVKLLPQYRRVWAALDRAPGVRRAVRRLTTRPGRHR